MLYGPDGFTVISRSYQFRDVWDVNNVYAEFAASSDKAALVHCRAEFRDKNGIITDGERMVGQQMAQEGGRRNE